MIRMVTLGTLKEITDLRKVWPHEALNPILQRHLL